MPITSTTPEPGCRRGHPSTTRQSTPSRQKAWFDLADAVDRGRQLDTRAVILRAEGGFNAGVDIKEMQRTEGFTALIDASRGCFRRIPRRLQRVTRCR